MSIADYYNTSKKINKLVLFKLYLYFSELDCGFSAIDIPINSIDEAFTMAKNTVLVEPTFLDFFDSLN